MNLTQPNFELVKKINNKTHLHKSSTVTLSTIHTDVNASSTTANSVHFEKKIATHLPTKCSLTETMKR